MKSIYKYAFLLAAAAGSLVSCSNDETAVKNPATEGKTVHLVVNALREGDDAESRTAMADNKGSLNCTWEAGDQILVASTNGIIKGKLTLTEGAGKTKATFEGDLTGVTEENLTLNYYYLGRKNCENGYADVEDQSYSHDFTNQNGTLHSLTDYDIMSVAKQTVVSNGSSYVEFIDLRRRVSFAHFALGLPAETAYPVTVTLSGSQLGNGAAISLANPEDVTYSKGNVVVTTNSPDIYITYIPTEGEYDITFDAVDAKGNEFTGKYTVKVNIGQNKFLRKAIKNEAGETIDGVGIPVPMDYSDGRNDEHTFVLTYDANYTNANPSFKNYTWRAAGTTYEYTAKDYTDVFPSREGYVFQSWNTKADGTGTTYNKGDKIPVTWTQGQEKGTLTVYAIWKQSTISLPGYGNGSFN